MSTVPPNDPKKPAVAPPQPGAKSAGSPIPGAKPPAPPTPGAKPGVPGVKPPAGGAPAPRPTAPGTPGVKPPAAPGVRPPGAPNPAAKPGAPAAQKPAAPAAPKPAPKPAPPRNRLAHVDSNSKQLGQKLVDLGYLDDLQLEDIYEEMRNSNNKLSEIAVSRGLVNDDQVLTATAEVHGMKLMSLEDVKPSPEALKIVPLNMAELYKMVPLSFEGGSLTVAMSDPNNLQAIDDI